MVLEETERAEAGRKDGLETAVWKLSESFMSGRFQLVMESGGNRPVAALTNLTCPLDTDF